MVTAPSRAARRRRPAHAVRLTALAAAEPQMLEVRRRDTIASLAARQRFRAPHIAVLNGEPVLRKQGGWLRRLKRGDELMFVECAAGGGGVKNVFRMALNIALVMSATAILGPAGLGLTGVAYAAGVAGAYVAAGYLVNALLPPETPGGSGFRSGSTASPTYSLNSSQNAARLGGVRPRLYGRHLVVPDLDAAPYTEYAGNDQYLYQVLNVSLGEVAVRELRLVDTVLWDDVDGYSDVFDGVEIEICAPGEPVTLFPADVVASLEVNALDLPGTNEEGAGAVGPFAANPAGTEATSIAFDSEWRAGAGRYTETGSLANVTTRLRYEARRIDDVGEPVGDWDVLAEKDYVFATLTPQRISERFPVALGRYQARMTRVNDAAHVSDDKARDAVIWSGLRAHIKGVTGSLSCTRIAVRMKASGQLSGLSARLFRVLAVSKLPLFEGFDEAGEAQWSASQETRDLFPIAMDILRNETYGGAVPDERIDIARFAALHDTWAARGDQFDGVFDAKTSVWKALQDVLRLGYAEPQMAGAMVTVTRDEPADAAAMVFTPENIAAGSLGVDYVFVDEDTPDSVIVEYWNEATWSQDEVLCRLAESTADKPARIQLFGCTDRTRAWRYGRRRAAENRYRRIFPRLTSGLEGRLLARGQPVLVSHPLPLWGRALAVESYDPATRLITLEGSAGLDDIGGWLRLRDRRGREWGPVRIEATPVASQAVLNEADVALHGDPATFIVIGDGAERTVASIGIAAGEADHQEGPLRCKVVTGAPGKGEGVELTLVNDDPRVYSADEGDPPPLPVGTTPPYVPARPVLQPLVVSQNIGTAYAPRLAYSVQSAAGASLYVWSISYDHVSWTEIAEGSNAVSGEVDVLPGTVWIACTAIGPGGRDRKEVFRDLTVTEAAPGQVTGIGFDIFFNSAIARFRLPQVSGDVEEGLRGVLLAWAFETGFDPEEEGERAGLARVEPATNRIEFPLAADEVFVRIAAYNVFGEAGLNWSSEFKISRERIDQSSLSETIQNALANAESIEGGVVFKLEDDGRLGGFVLVGGDGEPIEVGIQADLFQISHPGIEGGAPFPLFIADETGVRINNLVAATVTAEQIYAALVSVGRLEGLIFSSPIGEGETLDDAALVIDTTAPYILMRRPAS